jgi:hypothetical protein
MFRDITTVSALVACAFLLPGLRGEVGALTPRTFTVLSQAHRLQQRELEDSDIIRAKAGDKDKQQELVCAFYGKSADRMYIVASTELPAIGGWFAIRTYSLVLQPDTRKRWGRGHSDAYDVFRPSPTDIVFQKLPRLVPGLPKADPSKPDEMAAAWTRYIEAHQAELSKLQPRGEGIDWSGNACKSKPRERSIDE